MANAGRTWMNSSGNGNVNGNASVRNNAAAGAFGHQHSVRTRASAGSRRSVTPTSRAAAARSLPLDNDPESERVRVAVRLRPRNPMELSDADYADCVELQPELKRLKLRKNNWSTESYRFDEIFTESASQKRIYEAVAKPVVESVLEGYNGTVMAYGQTGTGKTYTLGRLGKDDASERGIMVRAMEDILASTLAPDSVEISYLQLYMESIQDLLAPEKMNISFMEDPKTGEISVPAAELVKIRNLDHFTQLLQLGEANRHAANTKMNTESSRSHAILMVHIRRSTQENGEIDMGQQKYIRDGNHAPTIRKSKLLIVDLAGSERLEKSGSEGHVLEEAKFINLSLTSLGKCINALAENSPHIPTRDSKLTRLLRDSFGGSARTSLITTIGPSARHHAETASTVMFGQRAMKVVNMVKVKEEFDYERLCRKLEAQVDHLSAEIDRHERSRETDKVEMQKLLEELRNSSAEAEAHFVTRTELLQKENARLTLRMQDLLQELDSHQRQNASLLDKIASLEVHMRKNKFLQEENARLEFELNNAVDDLKCLKDQNAVIRSEFTNLETSLKHGKQLNNSENQKILADTTRMYEEKIADLMKQMDKEKIGSSLAEEEIKKMKEQLTDAQLMLQRTQDENLKFRKTLTDTTKMYEERVELLNQKLAEEHARIEEIDELDYTKKLLQISAKEEIDELQMRLQEMHNLHETATNELQLLSIECKNIESEKTKLQQELSAMRQRLQVEERQRKEAEKELLKMMRVVPESEDGFEEKVSYMHENRGRTTSDFHSPQSVHKCRSRESILSQRDTITKICEEVGFQKILSLLESCDLDVQIHAVKVVANLAAEDINQERIVQEGGLDALLKLLDSSLNTTILRVASGAIANLAMNETNQGLITKKGGAKLLANVHCKTNDPQTLRMVAGAIANLCGNEKLHSLLKEEGAIDALLKMTSHGNDVVIAQVARGFANFAKCESRRIMQGNWRGRSLLMEDGGLSWLISNLNTSTPSTRRHIELAICHLAQNEENAPDFISSGGHKELIEISGESTREDIRNLAKKTLRLSPLFQRELKA
ncbi:kinesin-like protein KIN-UC isoform X2 [Andrographis paniculata]|uniref:kinesin-like protein KIN-UC isoform X2 n=1 Tax=Andrographis paniculata TaxID=175694 RepID=UPI0021E7341A|nr:kinesin-like protein KIN-UC isoform X2 [Andrographis paniculata]